MGGQGGSKQARKQEAAIAALLSEPTHAGAAQKAGVGEATLQRWLRDADFQAAYRQARRAVVDCAVGRLQQAAQKAVDALERNLDAEKPDVQVRAALGLLDHVWKGLDAADLLAEVADLKRQVEEMGRGQRDRQAEAEEAPGAGGQPSGGGDDPAAGTPPPGPGPHPPGGGDAPGPLASGGPPLSIFTDTPTLFQTG